MKRLGAQICAGLMLAGCAGRDPVAVSAYMPGDSTMTCQAIGNEIRHNNDLIRVRVDEDAETENRNIVIGVSAILLFVPAVLAMDMKGAAGSEAQAFEQRNRTLTGLAADRRCPPVRATTVAEAMVARKTELAAARTAENGDVPGVRTPTDQRLPRNQASAASAVAERSASAEPAPVDRTHLRALMDRFLRGEIGKDEYERLRAG